MKFRVEEGEKTGNPWQDEPVTFTNTLYRENMPVAWFSYRDDYSGYQLTFIQVAKGKLTKAQADYLGGQIDRHNQYDLTKLVNFLNQDTGNWPEN